MNNQQKKFMELLFNDDETVCVSHNKFAYHCIDQKELLADKILLVSNNENASLQSIKFEDINLITVNPIKGFRNDANCTAFRSFLVEADHMSLEDQRLYFEKELRLPASSCVASGNKSYHYLITLDHDLPDAVHYKYFAQWILNICSQADQATKNPSRATRFPDNARHGGNNQDVIHIGSRVSHAELFRWLFQWENHKPIQHSRSVQNFNRNFHNTIPPWVQDELTSGITTDRNITWFKHACSCFKNGWSLEELIVELEPYFVPEHDFNRREWIGVLKSAYQRVTKSIGEHNEQ